MLQAMNSIYLLSFLLLVFATIVTESIAEAKTYKINFESCLSCLSDEEKGGRDTVEEVHAYALLKKYPTGNLPPSSTICSSSMTAYGSYQIMFSLLGKDGNSWLGTFMKVGDKVTSFYHGKWSKVRLPPVFAHQWGKSCISVSFPMGRRRHFGEERHNCRF